MRLKELIKISNLPNTIENKSLVELAILENVNLDELKQFSLPRIESLYEKYSFLYDSNPLPPIREFSLNGVEYNLPLTLTELPYGIWIDLETILSNNQYGDTTLEKLPYILYILVFRNNYLIDNLSSNIEEGSKQFLDVDIKSAIQLHTFFLLLEKGSPQLTEVFMKEKLLKVLVKSRNSTNGLIKFMGYTIPLLYSLATSTFRFLRLKRN